MGRIPSADGLLGAKYPMVILIKLFILAADTLYTGQGIYLNEKQSTGHAARDGLGSATKTYFYN